MSLWQALLVVAGVVFAALALHGIWSVRRAQPRKAQTPVRVESRSEPSLHTAAGNAPDPLAPPPLTKRGARLDPLIDAVVPLALDGPVSGAMAAAHLPTTRRAGGKAFHIEGLNAESGEWETPHADARYSEFQAGLQMADRTGPVNEIEYSEFVQKVQAFADSVGAVPDFPDMLDVVAQGRELDAFAAPHDAHLAVHLRANGVAWSVGYVLQCAGRHGFVPGAVPGRAVLPGATESSPPVLQITYDAQAALAEDPNAAALREITLSFEVPQTPEHAEPFAAWQQVARALAGDMDATAVDDRGQPITLHAYASIAKELEVLYRALDARELSAGSLPAQRLFS